MELAPPPYEAPFEAPYGAPYGAPYAAAAAAPLPAAAHKAPRRDCACSCFPRFGALSRCETALVLLAAAAVAAAFVACAALIPWPGTHVVLLYPNEQATLTANGLFTRSVEVATADGDAPATVRGYTRAPPFEFRLGETMVLTDVLVQGMRNFSLATYVPGRSIVSTAMSNPYECWEQGISVYYYKFDSSETYQAFADTGDARSAYDSDYFVGSFSGAGTYHDGFLHFVLYNADCPMSKTPTTMTITVDSHRYYSPDAAHVFECTAGRCIDTIPYGEDRFYLAEVPFDPAGQDTVQRRTEVTLHGDVGAYLALYLGVFGSSVLVLAAALVCVHRRRAGKAETASESKALLAAPTAGS